MEDTKDKSRRVLDIYSKLMDGKTVYKKELAQKYGVNERTIQRDFDDVRDFLDKKGLETGIINDLIYDRSLNGYRLEYSNCMQLNNSEILAISKILLDSRAFTKGEMSSILHRMIDCCVPKENQKNDSPCACNGFDYFQYAVISFCIYPCCGSHNSNGGGAGTASHRTV